MRFLPSREDQGDFPPAPNAPEQPSPTPPHSDLEALVKRTQDVASMLKDLVCHGRGRTDLGILPDLLALSGLMEWETAPRFTASRLGRNRRWWANVDVDELSPASYDCLLALEASLNLTADIQEGSWPADLDDEDKLAMTFSRVAELSAREGRKEFTEHLLSAGSPDGEWAFRVRLCDFLENLPAPFRIVYQAQADLEKGVACLELEVPRPACMAMLAPDRPEAQERAAASYAYRLALACARGAFAASDRLDRMVVNCLHRSEKNVVLSVDVNRAQLKAAIEAASVLGNTDLPDDGTCRALPEKPSLTPEDELLNPKDRWKPVELMDVAASDELSRATGARLISDLGINENARKLISWNEMIAELGSTTEEAVHHLVALRAQTPDTGVRTACDRVSAALVEGTVDVSDRNALAHIYAEGDPLSAAHKRAVSLLGEEPTPDDLQAALVELDSVLAPLSASGAYQDDGETVFRYFNTAAERVSFNLATLTDDRHVALVPDEYYAAHSLAARILTGLGRADEGLAHADELRRIAPRSADAVLVRASCLEAQERIFECEDGLTEAIGFCSGLRELAICFYRLAFMEWRLGRNELAVACYQRCLSLRQEISSQAAGELKDLLDAEADAHQMTPEEVTAALTAAGIPLGNVDAILDTLRDAAAAATDAGLFSLARGYIACLLDADKDDALLGVYRSLASPSPEG